jgi:hypothetical protein
MFIMKVDIFGHRVLSIRPPGVGLKLCEELKTKNRTAVLSSNHS